jgi:glycosyltransferase involved in cell wall biosynthesis
MTKVSIILPVYNGEKYLSETIDSIIEQTFADWEIVAVNDGSTDNSHSILQQYKSNLGSKIKIIDQENSGVSVARNVAIDNSESEYLAFIDADDMWLPEKLEKQIKILDNNPDVALVYSDLLDLIENKTTRRKQILKRKLQRGYIFEPLFYFNFIALSSVVLRKEMIEKYGNFDSDYKIIQDYDLFLRIAEKNVIDYVDESLLIYRIHENNISGNMEAIERENFKLIEKWLKKKTYLSTSLKFNLKLTQLHYNTMRYYLWKRKYTAASGKLLLIFLNVLGVVR